ncbi:MAG: AAA family ATPase [Fusobacteriaceae bacterium]
MIDKLKIENFKGIKQIEIEEFKRINFFIGGNNCCKTTILEAISLINTGNIVNMLNNITKYSTVGSVVDSFFYGMDQSNEPKVEINESSDKNHSILKIAYIESYEKITKEEKTDEALSIVDSEVKILNYIFELDSKKNVLIAKNNRYRFTSSEEVKKPFFYIPSSRKSIDFFKTIQKLQTNKKIDEIIPILKNYDKDIERIYTNGTEIMVDLLRYDKSLPFDSMGDGFVSAAHIASYLLFYDNCVLLIDEIENGLYKNNIKKLIKYILKIVEKKNIQLFITTHSEEFLKSFYDEVEEKSDVSKVFRIEKSQKNNEEIKLVTYSQTEAKQVTSEGWEMR